MDKSAIRNFAIEARKMLMKSAETEAGFYGVTKSGCKSPIQKGNDFEVYETIAGTENRIYGADIKRRANLVKAVETLGFEQVIEETAYTWFNRIIAIRFMEVNDYLPTRVRVLSSETGSNTPDIVTQSLDVDLNMTPEELEKVQKAKDENRYDDAFRMLFIKQCNELNAILPGLFEKTDDYMELLLKLSYTSDGVVTNLVNNIAEEDFNIGEDGQVEIIGWLYQYYITEKHEAVVDPLHGKIVEKNDVPAATQLFTTDWVVKYLVDNSLGRIWMDTHPDSKLINDMSFYVPTNNGEDNKTNSQQLRPEDIKVFDPCMGSGHFLVYAFDLLMKIYSEEGYSERESAKLIIENNIFGLDIDDRAYQMAYFAVLMKARKYNRRLFSEKMVPNIHSIVESNTFDCHHIKYFGDSFNDSEREVLHLQIKMLVDTFKDAKEYGSLLSMPKLDFSLLTRGLDDINIEGQYSFETIGLENSQMELRRMIEIAKVMSTKYQVVITNPPYLNKYDAKLKAFVFDKYKEYSGDLFSVFMVKNLEYCVPEGYSAYMTPNVWMFIVSYEKLRQYLIENKHIVGLIQMAKGAFFKEATVDICAFILQNCKSTTYGSYFRLENFKGDMETQRVAMEKALSTEECDYLYNAKQEDFCMIGGSPIAYWVNEKVFAAFRDKKDTVSIFAQSEGKNVTTKNAKYILYSWEVRKKDIGAFDKHWLPCATGGDYRKWYGNILNVIDWSLEARTFYKKTPAGRIIREEFWNMPGVTWGKISSAASSFRILDYKEMYQETAILQKDINKTKLVLALLNSKVSSYFLEFLSPTLNYQLQDICSIPVPHMSEEDESRIVELCDECIEIMKEDWDSYETSLNFQKSPLIGKYGLIETAYEQFEELCDERFNQLKANEEELNRIFIRLYKLEGEIEAEEIDKEISIKKPTPQKEVKNLLSYFMGCVMGRFAINEPGILGCEDVNFDSKVLDTDGIIILTDERYFEDDIVDKLVSWISDVFGNEYIEDNLHYIAKILGCKGNSDRAVIRNYFSKEFFAEHCKTYQKAPIYWLFDAGKQNGFKCLVYLQRYTKDTLNLMRSQYLHKVEDAVENALKNAEYIIQTSASAVERAKATKDRDRYVKQLNEMRIYYQALSHLALQKIEIDLDDGVKHNYQLFQGIEVIADGGKKQKVDLLAKI